MDGGGGLRRRPTLPHHALLIAPMLRVTWILRLRIRRRILRIRCRIWRIRRGVLRGRRRIGRRRRLTPRAGHDHARAIAQEVGAVDHNALGDRQTGIDRRHRAVSRADADRPDGHGVVGVDDIDIGVRRAALNRRRRHRDRIVQGLYQKLSVDELVRE